MWRESTCISTLLSGVDGRFRELKGVPAADADGCLFFDDDTLDFAGVAGACEGVAMGVVAAAHESVAQGVVMLLEDLTAGVWAAAPDGC